ncbi:MAG: hypothetical protein ACRCST_05510 [Turicibacter sp.]
MNIINRLFFVSIVLLSLSACSLKFSREQVHAGRICKFDECVGLDIEVVSELLDIITASNFKTSLLTPSTEYTEALYEIVLTGKSRDSYFELQKIFILDDSRIINDSSKEYKASGEPLDLSLFEPFFE